MIPIHHEPYNTRLQNEFPRFRCCGVMTVIELNVHNFD